MLCPNFLVNYILAYYCVYTFLNNIIKFAHTQRMPQITIFILYIKREHPFGVALNFGMSFTFKILN